LVSKELMDLVHIYCMEEEKKNMEVNVDPSTIWLPKIFTENIQNIFFCAQHKKEIHTGLEQLEGE